jgi:hypothetical protein
VPGVEPSGGGEVAAEPGSGGEVAGDPGPSVERLGADPAANGGAGTLAS